MQYIADLHIHSPFSRATSKLSNLAGLFEWARIKGIQVVGTGDFTHPGWLKQLKEQLVPAEPGFFRLKDESIEASVTGLKTDATEVRFVLTSEISSIYKRDGKVRKIHNLLFVPDFASVERINIRLAAIGNIESDGRPILGLDSRNLLEILLESAPDGFLVPAHIWTPWFSLFGSKSGFDAIEDCFADLTQHIFALETGLSSDPEMNRLISALDRFTLISNSDCHSPSKLGREANLFNCDFNFFSMRDALKFPESGDFKGTIEFFPEEGKYHYDGHRKCNVCLSPGETSRLDALCPVCSRPLTVGVSHRVMELSDRKTAPLDRFPIFHSLIPLPEVLGEMLGIGPNTKGVMKQYCRLISKFGSEFNMLMNVPVEEIKGVSSVLAEAVQRIRLNKVIRNPGFDGEFGVIKVFEPGELNKYAGQITMFSGKAPRVKKIKIKAKSGKIAPVNKVKDKKNKSKKLKLNDQQEAAVNAEEERIIVTSGPGTGKTFTLVKRILRLLDNNDIEPEKIFAITFTNKAADELRQRLQEDAGDKASSVFVGTFHRFCLNWLQMIGGSSAIMAEDGKKIFLKRLFPEKGVKEIRAIIGAISEYFLLFHKGQAPSENLDNDVLLYLGELENSGRIDLDGVIPALVKMLFENEQISMLLKSSVDYLFVDEFQDVNQSQYDLVVHLSECCQVFVIGDPDQSIYGFRGSNPGLFSEFADIPGTGKYSLSHNYRNSSVFLKAADMVVSNNKHHGNNLLKAQSPDFNLIEYYSALTPETEASWIVRQIIREIGGTSHLNISQADNLPGKERESGFSDFAVLVRNTRQCNEFVQAFSKQSIPFQLIGGIPFFMEPEIRPLFYWIRTSSGLAGISDYLKILPRIKGIGVKAIAGIEKQLSFSNENFWQQIREMDLSSSIIKKLESFNLKQVDFSTEVKSKGLSHALESTLKDLKIDSEHINVQRLLNLAGSFGHDLRSLSEHLHRYAAETVYDQNAEAVALMTIHAAKGLEFSTVFIAGLEEGIIPSEMARLENEIEEERRLFYVGITRAKQRLVLSSSASRVKYGKNMEQKLSSFFYEISPDLIKILKTSKNKPARKKKPEQLRLF
jgi:DNA helicase II / ATP-dependent DNA helicase PcrA